MGTMSMVSKLNRPVRRRNMYVILSVIILLEIALFAWSYLSKTNPLKTVTEKLPLGAVVPTFQANIYGPLGDPLNKPMAVVVVNKQIYVSDTNNQRVQIFDYDGKPISAFGKSGEKAGEFKFPYGIAGDAQGQIYVTDLYNGNISIFSSDGQFIKYFGKKGDFNKPAGIAIDGDKMYISDVALNQIFVYSLDGTQLLKFGEKGEKDGQLNSPNVVQHLGNRIYVADTGNDRIEVFDEQGNLLSKATSELANPRGLSVDAQGNIYVVSNLSSKVVVFNSKGERLFTFGGVGSDDGLLSFPNGLTRDSQGRFYVTDVGNGRVVIYQ